MPKRSTTRPAPRSSSPRERARTATTEPVPTPIISPDAAPGVVTRAFGKWFSVQLNESDRSLLSTIKGTVKRERLRTDVVAVGDRVWVVDVGDNEGQIEAVDPRTRVLARLARHTDDVEQVILANPDQVLFVFSVAQPVPHRRMLDRFLVLAEFNDLPIRIGISKIDLDEGFGTESSLAKAIFADYEPIYPVLYFSTKTGQGCAELHDALAGRTTAIAGPSGVGKSSLLNWLDPDEKRAIGEVSDATGKGRHTTTATQLYALGDGTFIADTPGIRALAMNGVPVDEIDRCFPELRPYLGDCFYADCTHLHEPGCAVLAALEQGALPPARYESYAALRRGDPPES
jgi:ribosome biogenesis GTPase